MLAGIGLELGWRLTMRPRLAWNDAGVANIGPTSATKVRWERVTGFTRDSGRLRIHTKQGPYSPLPGYSRVGDAGPDGTRTIDQLHAALQDAHTRALRSTYSDWIRPPEPEEPARAWASLAGIWFVITALGAALLLWH